VSSASDSDIDTARSTAFSSSRTLPGQGRAMRALDCQVEGQRRIDRGPCGARCMHGVPTLAQRADRPIQVGVVVVHDEHVSTWALDHGRSDAARSRRRSSSRGQRRDEPGSRRGSVRNERAEAHASPDRTSTSRMGQITSRPVERDEIVSRHRSVRRHPRW
jgi:hypothetical protein